MSAARFSADEQIVRYWSRETSAAAVMFERRWTLAALNRVDPELAERLSKQQELFNRATMTGTIEEVEAHGAAMSRGYAAAVRALEANSEPDDAYTLGQDPRSGLKIAIGHQKSAVERVGELHGSPVIWISPDEVAAVLSQLEGLKALTTVKKIFPGAELIDIRPYDPANHEVGQRIARVPPTKALSRPSSSAYEQVTRCEHTESE
jgi:hypothetical protein